MEIRKFLSLGMNFDDGVMKTKFLLPIYMAGEENVLQIKNLFDHHGYELSIIPGEFVKIFTLNEKEIAELGNTLNEIDALGLKEVMNANLKPAAFKSSTLNRIKFCLENGIPFLNSDNTLATSIYDTEATYEVRQDESFKPNIEETVNVEPVREFQEPVMQEMDPVSARTLDEEDLMVKSDIIKILTEINRSNPSDSTLTFLISSVITNLDTAILNDNKNYRIMGIRHIVEDTLQGMAMTPDMQALIDEKILAGFPVDVEKNRGASA